MTNHKSIRLSLWIVLLFSFASTGRTDPPQIQVSAGDIKDSRPSSNEPGGMKVELKLAAVSLPDDAKGFRVAITKAVDDTGLDLCTSESTAPEFKNIKAIKSFELKLKNPARKATTIKELTGTVELLVPKNDPTCSIVLDHFEKHMNVPVESDALKSAGVDVVPRTGRQYEAREQKNQAEGMKAASQEQRKRMQAFASRPSNMRMDPNDIAVSIEAGNNKVVGFEFRDESNKTIQPSGSGVSYRQDGPRFERALTYHFNAPLPEKAKLVILLATPGALVKVPFTLTDIPLP